MTRVALTGAELVDPEATSTAPATLLVEDGLIVGRLDADAVVGEDWQTVSLPGHLLAPGFIDLHFHGELAVAPVGTFEPALQRCAARMLGGGTTAFLATTLAWPEDTLASHVSALAEAAETSRADLAQCIGLHLEGPWINPAAPGAMQASAMRGFAASRDVDVLDRVGDRLALVTLAPELEGAGELLEALARRGAVAALGHSNANPEQIDAAIDRGLRHVTHLFNAMGPIHHRKPGVAGSVLAEDRLSCDLICDGAHVHPSMVRVAARALDERLMLITDRVDLEQPGDIDPTVDESPNRLEDGTLLGSRLTLDRAIANVRAFAGSSLNEAVAACTLRPARLLGIEAERGTLRDGARADFAVLTGDGRVSQTWIGGKAVWQAR